MAAHRRGFLYYGPAPTIIAVIALITGLVVFATGREKRDRPDLVCVIFAKEHLEGMNRASEQFRQKTGKRVDIQLVESRALNSRLQAAFQSGADVPDLVEVLEPNMGLFTKGPIEEVGFMDLTDRLKAEGWFDKLVDSRFSLWSSRGRVFAIPHDVHPVMLAYRRDLVEAEGIDVSKLTTWEEFARVGRELTAKYRRSGGGTVTSGPPDNLISDRYMMDLPSGGSGTLSWMLLQRGVNVLDADGKVAYDVPDTTDTILWYVKAVYGPGRMTFDCGWGQNFSTSLINGLVLFVPCADWRTKTISMEIPSLAGKLALMPLPRWTNTPPGNLRTSVSGGTGLAITKRSKNPELAWEFAKFAYYDPTFVEERFKANNILSPLKSAWKSPALTAPDPFWSGQARGSFYAELAMETPQRHVSSFTALAEGKLAEALVNSLTYYRNRGEEGLREFIDGELRRTADQVRLQIGRNRFYAREAAQTAASSAPPAPNPLNDSAPKGGAR